MDVEDERSLSIGAIHGFVKGQVRRESLLDLTSLHMDVVVAATERVREQGIELFAFAPSNDHDWQDFYAAFVPLHNAAPDGAAGRTPPRYETVRAGYTEPWQILLARRGAAIVGMTVAYQRADLPSRVVTYFTGVVSTEQGHGIATALKAEHAASATRRRLARTFDLEYGGEPSDPGSECPPRFRADPEGSGFIPGFRRSGVSRFEGRVHR